MPPVVLAFGAGVDSSAMLIELVERGTPPDLVLFADTGAEKRQTYAWLEIMRAWMDDHDIENHVVRYVTRRFKHYPPYHTLTESLLTNGCLPSISFGRHSCSLKYKAGPQDAFLKNWQPARDAWANGHRIIRLIGYDAGPRDKQRYSHASTINDPLYECRYPLIEWGWSRAQCEERIIAAGLPLCPKSSCTFCLAMKPTEVDALDKADLRANVLIEARAKPRLTTVEGLWRRGTRARPGSMTEYIRERGLLPAAEITEIIETCPTELVLFQDAARQTQPEFRTPMTHWLERFHARFT